MSYHDLSHSAAAMRKPPSAPLQAAYRKVQPQEASPRLSLAEATARSASYLSRPLASLAPILFGGMVLAALYASWSQRNEGHLTPETGAGYWLGVSGGVIILTLLVYPLRKRFRSLRALGKVPVLFRMHMILGILGPSLIVMHSNWHLSSLNATAAMIVMLTVVSSGIIGRYLYSKVHRGLYGRRAQVRDILADASIFKRSLGENIPQTAQLIEELHAFEADVLARREGFLAQSYVFLTLGARQALLRNRLMRVAKATISAEGQRRGWSSQAQRKRFALVGQHLSLYFAATRKAARLGVYERLFALWHVLHMPLFFLLIAAAIVHVIAVHLY
jgi:hypothetical protein